MEVILETLQIIIGLILLLFFLYVAARIITKGVMKSYYEYYYSMITRGGRHYAKTYADTDTETGEEEETTTCKDEGTTQDTTQKRAKEKANAFRRSSQNEKGLVEEVAGRSRT